MPENTTTEDAVTDPAQGQEAATERSGAKLEADTDWVAEARKWESRAKENAAKARANEQAAARLAEIEEANKTEAQKLADRLAAAEAKAAQAELKALRAEVAQTKGVPAELLTGTNLDELTAAADALIAFRGEVKPPPVVPSADGQGNVGKPLGQGKPQFTAEDVKRLYAAKRYDDIEAARQAGQLDALLGITKP